MESEVQSIGLGLPVQTCLALDGTAFILQALNGNGMNQKTRVLIVDDDVAMAKYLAGHLARRNFEVTVASTEQEALRIFRSLDPVLVLLDTSMNSVGNGSGVL